MSKFIADVTFWELFPDAKLGVVLLKNIRLEKDSQREIKKLLRESNENVWNYLTEGVFSENRVIKVYREALQKFKTKKKERCSIEALLKRVKKNNPVSTINPLH